MEMEQLQLLLASDNASNTPSNPLTEAAGQVGAPTIVASVPAFAMMCGFFLVCCCRPSRVVQAIFQNLSAGLIIGSVAGELFPLLALDERASWENNVGLIAGFLLGIVTMFGLDKLLDLCGNDEDDDDDQGDDKDRSHSGNDLEASLIANAAQPAVDPSNIDLCLDVRADLRKRFTIIMDTLKSIPLTNRDDVDEAVHRVQAFVHASRRKILQNRDHRDLDSSDCVRLGSTEKAHLQRWMKHLLESTQHLFEHLESKEPLTNEIKTEILGHILDLEAAMEDVHKDIETKGSPRARHRSQRRWAVLPPPSMVIQIKPIAWSFVIAVCVDAFVDGFLAGLSFIAQPSAGFIMAGATCIEMGFLGITFVGTLQASTTKLKLLGICAIPLVLLVGGGFTAGVIGNFIQPGTAVFEGLISFCVVALLFLVTQELLTEANENLEGKEIVWVNVMIFIGILIVIVVERVTSSV